MTILLFKPDSDSGEFNETHEVDEQLVVSGGDAAELFELVEEALDAVSFLVEIDVVRPLQLSIALGRDDDLDATFCHPVDEMIGVVSLVGDSGLGVDVIDQVVGKGDVVALAGRTNQAQGEAERLGSGVDLGTQAAARAAQTLGIRPPLILRAPAAC